MVLIRFVITSMSMLIAALNILLPHFSITVTDSVRVNIRQKKKGRVDRNKAYIRNHDKTNDFYGRRSELNIGSRFPDNKFARNARKRRLLSNIRKKFKRKKKVNKHTPAIKKQSVLILKGNGNIGKKKGNYFQALHRRKLVNNDERRLRRRKLVDDEQWDQLNDLLRFIEWHEVSNTFTQVADSLRDALSGITLRDAVSGVFSFSGIATREQIMQLVGLGNGILNLLSASEIESFVRSYIVRWLTTSNWGETLAESLRRLYGVDDTTTSADRFVALMQLFINIHSSGGVQSENINNRYSQILAVVERFHDDGELWMDRDNGERVMIADRHDLSVQDMQRLINILRRMVDLMNMLFFGRRGPMENNGAHRRQHNHEVVDEKNPKPAGNDTPNGVCGNSLNNSFRGTHATLFSPTSRIPMEVFFVQFAKAMEDLEKWLKEIDDRRLHDTNPMGDDDDYDTPLSQLIPGSRKRKKSSSACDVNIGPPKKKRKKEKLKVGTMVRLRPSSEMNPEEVGRRNEVVADMQSRFGITATNISFRITAISDDMMTISHWAENPEDESDSVLLELDVPMDLFEKVEGHHHEP